MKIPEIYKTYDVTQDEATSRIHKLIRNGYTVLSKRSYHAMGRVVMSYTRFDDEEVNSN